MATGLILAGGAGSRVGRRDKGLLLWQGRPLAAWVTQRLDPQVGSLIISCNRNSTAYRRLAARTVTDSRTGYQGPLAGIEAAAPLVQTPFLVLTACDTPDIPANLVQRLLLPLLAADEIEISYVNDGERDQYLCAALRRECLPSLTPYLDGGGRAVRHWYHSRKFARVDFGDCAMNFRNFNRGLEDGSLTPDCPE